MLKKLIVLLMVLLTAPQVRAEDRHAVIEFHEADAIVLSANLVINGMMGGTGAYLKDHPDFRPGDFGRMIKSQTYWRGFYQGAIGGSLVYAGAKTMTMQPEYDYAVLAGKQLSDLGTSITYSAAENQDWLENPSYVTDVGPLVFHWQKSTGFLPRLYLLPDSLVFLIYDFNKYDFEPEFSLKTGHFVFSGEMDEDWYGFTRGNDIVLHHGNFNDCTYKEYEIQDTLAHEAIHTRVIYFQFLPIDILIDRGFDRLPDEYSSSSLKRLHGFVRIGPYLSFQITNYLGDVHENNGAQYDDRFDEYPNYHLHNYLDY